MRYVIPIEALMHEPAVIRVHKNITNTEGHPHNTLLLYWFLEPGVTLETLFYNVIERNGADVRPFTVIK